MNVLRLIDYQSSSEAECLACGHKWRIKPDVRGRVECVKCPKRPWWEQITQRYWKRPLA